ncbi:carboxypeptidase-like regulatory domain-containing protein [Runella sp.]|jgi:iron complex outermembrane receptor protein|uniref:carboxypeptidase-like regulatory domain-containing protein n=1 Tax=Runella sp. TaxID=1960881 RepID=UPI00260E36B1|nr:carboxypeptidase-like regulatory domain-containing protein [Runella sp.]
MRKVLLFSLLSVFIGIGKLMAQDRILSGTVKDENGQLLPGVNVLLKGTNRGITSDGDGAFKLSVPGSGTLMFSSVGYALFVIAGVRL